MNCNQKSKKLFFVILLATIFIINLVTLNEPLSISQFDYHSFEPVARLFQLLFILFIISPPLIVVLLFLIWKELKQRNKMK
ncbi:MAG TPA: hypothetical protein VF556_15835 [Pyrinomonadaceae bacterium]